MSTYGEMFRDTAARSESVEALVFIHDRLSYEELLERATWRARELRALGVGRGDRFAVLMPNSPEIVELLIGGSLIGATMVPMNTRFKARELRHVITDAEVTALFTTDVIDEHVNFKTLLVEALQGLEDAPAVALVGTQGAPGMLSGPELRVLAASQPEPAPDDLPEPADTALILYTSGTTAHPKGCMLSHRAIVLDAAGIAERFRIPAGERWWDPLPMFHAGALMLMTACFIAGATFISMLRFDVDEAFDLIENERVNVHYPLFPTITLTLMHHPRFHRLDLSETRVVVNVSPPDVQRQIQDAYAPAILMNAYGITELCGTVVFTDLDDPVEVRTETCGRALPGFELRVVDPETNRPVPTRERGELVGRGPSGFDGYFRNEEGTRAAVDDDGWFHTGDLCSMDEKGYVSYHGRLKDMLKVGGENVAAIEVESFLATHPSIKLAQIVGVPDPRLIEVPAAFVELAPGAELGEEEVIAYCRDSIAGFKVPRHVRFVTEWPMSATKIQKFQLRDRLIEELGRAPGS
jgi:acyl-CoA synthetase (AMP-forming)/AMP-acid ligase II